MHPWNYDSIKHPNINSMRVVTFPKYRGYAENALKKLSKETIKIMNDFEILQTHVMNIN